MLNFPTADRSAIDAYNSNYLKTVVFQLRYSKSDSILSNKEHFISVFQNKYPRINDQKESGFQVAFRKDQTPIVQPIESGSKGFRFASADGQKIVNILDDSITLTISGIVYRHFNSIVEELREIIDALNALGINSFNRVAIRKINLIEFEIPAEFEDLNPIQVMQMLLHDGLVNNIGYFPDNKNISKSLHTVVYNTDNAVLNLQYGVIQNNTENRSGHVVIDIDLFSLQETTVGEVIELWKNINNEIFNIFIWAMKPDAIVRLMEKKND